MDDAGTEHEAGWLLVEDGVVAAVGDGRRAGGRRARRPRRRRRHARASSTRTTTCTRPSRARGRSRPTSSAGCASSIPIWARIDAEAEYAAARTGLAELALSGCTTVFDHHYVFPRGRDGPGRGGGAGGAGARRPHRRLARLDGPRRVATAASRRTSSSRTSTRSSPTPSGSSASCTSRAPARASRSPSRRARRSRSRSELMAESAELARRLGLHAAHPPRRDGRGGGVLPGALRLHARSSTSTELGWLGDDVWCAHCVHLSADDVGRLRRARARASRTARPRTSGSARASRPCASCSTPASASGSASTARRRTSAATSSSR